MFRKPRDDSATANINSLGRPPTPPGTPVKTPFTLAVPPTVQAPKMAATKSKKGPKQVPLPVIGRQGATPKKATATPKSKKSGKPNTSILSFFKKSESGGKDNESLFIQDGRDRQARDTENTAPSPAVPDDDQEDEDEARYNEVGGAVKRRKFDSQESAQRVSRPSSRASATSAQPQQYTAMPFIQASDSEDDEDEQPQAIIPIAHTTEEVLDHTNLEDKSAELEKLPAETPAVPRPPLIKEETSYGPDFDDFAEFGDEFDEDLFEEGDEYVERKYLEEQAQIEREEAERNGTSDDTMMDASASAAIEAGCPICNESLSGLTEQEAGVHVNHCLDGNPTPLPKPKKSTSPPPLNGGKPGAQFKKPVRAPKPGQADPFAGSPSSNGGSAFSKLMSGHAEDAAWAEAAASEHAARGKPAYQRTCPFYKILPGLSICVDAFRYGAVAGCQAYFLSHFHSDHYIGLTSSWSHGPIYCSRVTGNLVRQQLRVDPKWVVDLEFEETVDVPNTRGVKLTMISANHCPGSSLFLFEKVVGKKTNGEPRLQRILHCGDFRACRMHVEHPLLMPSVQDKVSGKNKEQKLDVCYLDTTYLNPKYAFPSQERVITACADMCVSLNKHTVDDSDGWEQMKKQRAGEGMVKFIQRESSMDTKDQLDDDTTVTKDDMKVERNPHGSQQIISSTTSKQNRGRLLVVVGTYSIGKERICLGIARALKSKIYAPTQKQRIVAALEDPELNALMTTDPRAAQVHMTPLFEIRADTLDDYLKDYFPHFSRAVGFRPSGWNYRPPNTRFLESPSVSTVLNGDNWKSNYSMKDLTPQRGSTSRASCFAVPYSEHSSFRELTMFCCALKIEKIIPTVNVGNAKSRQRMKAWCERWAQERRKNGVWELPADGSWS